MDSKSVKSFLIKNKIDWLELQFTDFFGSLRQVLIPADELNESSMKNGFAKLDGSSVTGFADIENSDMVLMPIPETLTTLPWSQGVARVLNKIYCKAGSERFERDPRNVAELAQKYLSDKGYSSFFAPESEFFLFDSVDLDVDNPASGIGYKIKSSEAPASGSSSSIPYKGGYYPVTPLDKTYNTRLKIVKTLKNNFDFKIEATHHEVATAGQAEINYRYSEMLDAADKFQTLKFVARNIAKEDNLLALFMPKPFVGDNGSGMHTNFSIWNKSKDKNLMYDPKDKYSELSQLGRYAVGGLMEHARALSAIVSPSTNSYKRLVPGYEAPVYIAWSKSNRSAAIRIPTYHRGQEATKRIEYRPPDPLANPYLAFSALLLAALDGIENKKDPGDPIDENIYHLSKQKRSELGVNELPGDLNIALDELESDNKFLQKVFPVSVIDTYLELKRAEAKKIGSYPNPIEFYTYASI